MTLFNRANLVYTYLVNRMAVASLNRQTKTVVSWQMAQPPPVGIATARSQDRAVLCW